MANPEVKFKVDTGQLEQLRRNAREMYSEMQRNAMEQSKDVSEVNAKIKEQIHLLEERKKAERSQRISDLRDARDTGAISKEQYREGVKASDQKSFEDKVHTRLLKEISESIRAQSKTLTDTVRLRSSSDASLRQNIDSLENDVTGSSDDIMARRMAARNLRRKREEESVSDGDAGAVGGGLAEEAAKRTAGMGMPASLISVMSKGGPIGLALAAAAGLGIGSITRTDAIGIAGRGYGALTGGNFDTVRGLGDNLRSAGIEQMGLSTVDAITNYAPYMKAYGGRIGMGNYLNLLASRRALDLDDSQIQEVLATSRFGGNNPLGTLGSFERFTRGKHGDISLLGEYLNQYSTAAQGVLGVAGGFEAGNVAGVTQWLGGNMTGPQLGRTLGAFQGLGQQGGMTQALMYQAARELNPNASTWELGKMVENPLDNPELIKQLLGKTRELTSGGDDRKYLLQQALGISKHDIDALLGAEGKEDLSSVVGRVKGVKGAGYTGRAESLTGVSEVAGATIANAVDDMATGVREAGERLISAIVDIAEKAAGIGGIGGMHGSAYRTK